MILIKSKIFKELLYHREKTKTAGETDSYCFPAVLQDGLLNINSRGMPVFFITQIAGKDSSKTENKLNSAAVLLYRSRFLLLLRHHFFDAGKGYGTDDMLNPAGVLFRGVRGNI